MTTGDEQTPEGGVPIAGPNPHFFDDPITDCLTNMILELAAQVWVNRERLMAFEEVLARDGVISADAVEDYRPSADRAAALRSERDRFVLGIMKQIQRLAEPGNTADRD